MKPVQYIVPSLLSLAALIAIGCGQSKFSSSGDNQRGTCVDTRPEVQCTTSVDENGVTIDTYNYSISSANQPNDILFVVDNSKSMSEEQAAMAARFNAFMNTLSNVDYRIAITTTDTSITNRGTNPPRAANQNGALQDGRLITFPNGAPFLDKSLDPATAQTLFQQTVTRTETQNCDFGISGACPSGDERGILAAAMTIENNYSNFIRPNGHMAVVFLSDEDEGSDGVLIDNREVPNNFVNLFRSYYPNKSIKAHSIIIQPNTQAGINCYNQQLSQPIYGQFGTYYAELSRITGGVVGDICASSYTNQLAQIGQAVAQQREVLPCRPINNLVNVAFNPAQNFVQWQYDTSQNQIVFNGSVPAGTEINFSYQCQR